MRNLFLTSAVILTVVLLTSCSKDDAPSNETSKLPANEVAVNPTTGTFVVNGKTISLAKFFNISPLKLSSIDTLTKERSFYAVYSINVSESEDTTVVFYSIFMNTGIETNFNVRQSILNSNEFYTTSKPKTMKVPLDKNVSVSLVKNVLKVVESSNYHTPSNYNINVVSMDKSGEYFRATLNENTTDTLTFPQRKRDNSGFYLSLSKGELYNIYKKNKVVVKDFLPISNKAEFENCNFTVLYNNL